MPSILKRTVMTANGTAEPISGDANEFLREPSAVEIGIVCSATGVLADAFVGSDQVLDQYPIPVATINVSPRYPDEFTTPEPGLPGERIRIRLRETAAATPTVMTAVRITPQ